MWVENRLVKQIARRDWTGGSYCRHKEMRPESNRLTSNRAEGGADGVNSRNLIPLKNPLLLERRKVEPRFSGNYRSRMPAKAPLRVR